MRGAPATAKTMDTDITGSTGAFSLRVPHGLYDIRLPSNAGYDFTLNGIAEAEVDGESVVSFAIPTVAPGENRSLGTIKAGRNNDEPAPVFIGQTSFSVPERTTMIGMVKAVNPATGSATGVTYEAAVAALSPADDDAAGNVGNIVVNPTTGALMFNDPPPVFDSETDANNVYKGPSRLTSKARLPRK